MRYAGVIRPSQRRLGDSSVQNVTAMGLQRSRGKFTRVEWSVGAGGSEPGSLWRTQPGTISSLSPQWLCGGSLAVETNGTAALWQRLQTFRSLAACSVSGATATPIYPPGCVQCVHLSADADEVRRSTCTNSDEPRCSAFRSLTVGRLKFNKSFVHLFSQYSIDMIKHGDWWSSFILIKNIYLHTADMTLV